MNILMINKTFKRLLKLKTENKYGDLLILSLVNMSTKNLRLYTFEEVQTIIKYVQAENIKFYHSERYKRFNRNRSKKFNSFKRSRKYYKPSIDKRTVRINETPILTDERINKIDTKQHADRFLSKLETEIFNDKYKVPTCRHWLKERCCFGTTCRFSHSN